LFIHLTETEEVIEGPEIGFASGHDHHHFGRIVTKIRKPKLFGIPLGKEVTNFALCNLCNTEFILEKLPEELLEEKGIKYDVTAYVTKEHSPLFPKLIVLLTYMSMIVPVLPFLLRLALIADFHYLKGVWRWLYSLILPVAVLVHLVFWPYIIFVE
jgi:hypothetical protein